VGETPLPIPNRAVKPHSADGTWPSRAWESRSPPVLHSRAAPRGGSSPLTPPVRAFLPAVLGDPKRSGRPEAAQVRWSFARPARPSSQTGRRRAGWSGAPRRLMGYRRDADLCAWRDLSWPAPARVTTGWPAVRVLARGGGVGPVWGLCLTQRRERGGRVYGLAHQLAQRALPRAAGDRRGEHVFGRLGTGSDGTRNVRRSDHHSARIWLWAAIHGRGGCNRSCTDGFRGPRHSAGRTTTGGRRSAGPERRDRPG
jgi:hypothetical protein